MNSTLKYISIFILLIFVSFAFPGVSHAVTPSSEAKGQVIKLDFSIPGIGSQSSNLAPLTLTRDVYFYFYKPDVNSLDSSVKPIATFKTDVKYDGEFSSPTFGSFTNFNIDLADKVPDGIYQISFKTLPSLPLLIKEEDKDIGGKLFTVKRQSRNEIEVTGETVIMGDIHPDPNGNNAIDIDDFYAFVSCFAPDSKTTPCDNTRSSDFDDNGLVDGTDYNLFLGSLRTLLNLGYPVPKLPDSLTPVPTIAKKVTPTKKPTNESEKNKQNGKKDTQSPALGILGILIPLVVVAGVGVGAFFLIKKMRSKTTASEGVEKLVEKENKKEEAIDREYYVKKQSYDEVNKRTVFTLTDDNGPTLGYYTGPEIGDGFYHVKGVLKNEGEKVFIEVSEITPETETTA